MKRLPIGWQMIAGQRYYVTGPLRQGLQALAAGPRPALAIYPRLGPLVMDGYLRGLIRQGLVTHDHAPLRTRLYRLTDQGRAVRAALCQEEGR